MLYSKSTKGFYFDDSEGAPSDCVYVSDDAYKALMLSQERGFLIEPDASGYPVSVDKYTPTTPDYMGAVKSELRKIRAPMLDALSGIAGRASRAGREALAQEADALAEQLLDITADEDLNAATTYDAMQSAGVMAYRRIAASASPELASVFKEITGA